MSLDVEVGLGSFWQHLMDDLQGNLPISQNLFARDQGQTMIKDVDKAFSANIRT